MAAARLEVIRQMVERTNAHDLEGMSALMHEDHRSEQPFHPAVSFSSSVRARSRTFSGTRASISAPNASAWPSPTAPRGSTDNTAASRSGMLTAA